jgi:hypothetical protein
MLNFRYVLHLGAGDSERIVRHVSFRALHPGEVISVPGHGDWRVGLIVPDGETELRGGIVYCEPAEDQSTAIG